MNFTNSNTSFSGGVQFAWDSASIKLAETCPRKYQYVMLESWAPGAKSVHLEFGGHYATALEHYHKHRALGVPHNEALIEVVEEALVNTWDHELGIGGERLPGTGQAREFIHSSKTRANLIRSIVWYLDEFEQDSMTTIILDNGKPAVELSFTLPVDDEILFSGHLDRLVRYSDDPYVMDQKTTGSALAGNYFDQFKLDTQMSMYTFAGKAIFGIPVKGVVIDAAQIMVGFTRFARGFTFRSEDQLNEWYDETLALIHRTRKMTKVNHFPRNTSACNNYGGCEFRSVCSQPRQFRDQFLRGDFIKREPWDPLKRR